MTQIYLLAGLPGAGKTTAAEMLAEQTNGTVISLGDEVREMYIADHDDEPESSALGKFAAELREQGGEAAITDRVIGQFLRGEREEAFPLIIDSVRHRQEIVSWREFVSDTKALWISAGFEKRFTRIKKRAREGEGDFDEVELLQRDERELYELGVNTIYNNGGCIDDYIDNTAGEEELRERLEELTATYANTTANK